MNSRYFLFLLGFTLLLTTGCFNDEEVPIYNDIEGVVLLDGSPVSGAEIHIRNHFEPGGFSVATEAPIDFSFQFNAYTEGNYTASLFRHGSDTNLVTFFEDTLESGLNELTVPDSLLSNGIFGYEVRRNSNLVSVNLFLINKPDSTLPGTLPFTTTLDNGTFNLNATYLALGQTFATNYRGGFEITDSLLIYVVQDQDILKKEPVHILPDQSNFIEITLD